MAEGNGNTQDDQGGEGGEGGKPAATFETWFDGLSEDVQGLVTGHVDGLRSALQSERGNRKDLEKKLRDAAGKLEAGSDARAELERMAGEMELSTKRADVYEAASAAGVTNLKLVWAVVQQEEGLIDRRGNLDVDALRKDFPELFSAGKPAPRGNAGDGINNDTPGGGDMNAWIRRSAGYEQ